MEIKDHPSFAKWFQKTMIAGWLCLVLVLALFYFEPIREQKFIFKILIIAFLSGGLSFVIYLFRSVRSVVCPICENKTKHNKIKGVHSAKCQECQINWNLGVGTRDRM